MPRGGARPSSTRSTYAVSPMATAMGSVTSQASGPDWTTWLGLVSTPCGSHRGTRRRCTTEATTSPTTATSTRRSAPSRTRAVSSSKPINVTSASSSTSSPTTPHTSIRGFVPPWTARPDRPNASCTTSGTGQDRQETSRRTTGSAHSVAARGLASLLPMDNPSSGTSICSPHSSLTSTGNTRTCASTSRR